MQRYINKILHGGKSPPFKPGACQRAFLRLFFFLFLLARTHIGIRLIVLFSTNGCVEEKLCFLTCTSCSSSTSVKTPLLSFWYSIQLIHSRSKLLNSLECELKTIRAPTVESLVRLEPCQIFYRYILYFTLLFISLFSVILIFHSANTKKIIF